MRGLVLLVAIALPVASAAAPPAGKKAAAPAKVCANSKIQWTDRGDRGAQVRNLAELPPGDLLLAVVRDVDGCIEPAAVGYSYGGVAPRERRPEKADRR